MPMIDPGYVGISNPWNITTPSKLEMKTRKFQQKKKKTNHVHLQICVFYHFGYKTLPTLTPFTPQKSGGKKNHHLVKTVHRGEDNLSQRKVFEKKKNFHCFPKG